MGNTPVLIAGGRLTTAKGGTETIVIGDGGTGAYGTSKRRGTRVVYSLTTTRLKVGTSRIVITSANIVKRGLPVRPVHSRIRRLTHKLSPRGRKGTTGTVVAASACTGRATISFALSKGAYAINNVTGKDNVVRPGVTAALGFIAASITVSSRVVRGTLSRVMGIACGYLDVSKSASAGSVIDVLTGNVTRGAPIATRKRSCSAFHRTLCRMLVALAGVLTGSNRKTSGVLRYAYDNTPSRSATVVVTGDIVHSPLFGYTVFKRSTG